MTSQRGSRSIWKARQKKAGTRRNGRCRTSQSAASNRIANSPLTVPVARKAGSTAADRNPGSAANNITSAPERLISPRTCSTRSGFLLEWLGVARFPLLVVVLLALLLGATTRLPLVREPPHTGTVAIGALAVLRRPPVAWFFASVFFTVLGHAALYVFFSLYLVSLGYSTATVGLMWALSVAVEVAWFWFQGRWVDRLSLHGWLVLAAIVTALRFAATASFADVAWVLVAAQCTHAITFAAQHTACIGVINRHFPGRLRGRGQALYSLLGYGASGLIGGVGGGALSAALGFAAVFWAASGAAALAALCAWRALRLEHGGDRAAREPSSPGLAELNPAGASPSRLPDQGR